MFNRVVILLVAASLATIGCGVAPSDSADAAGDVAPIAQLEDALSNAVTLTEADNGATIEVIAGQSVIVSLAANHTTGNTWLIKSVDSALAPPESIYVESTEPGRGRGGTQTFTWTTDASSVGIRKVDLEYKRPWLKTVTSRFSVTLDIKAAASKTAIWPTNATKLVAESAGGGFTPPAPPGSTCAIGKAKYTLDVATRRLSWELCEWRDDGQPLRPTTGSRMITARGYATVDKAMRELRVTTQEICGADKPALSVKVSVNSSTRTYYDAFYACEGGKKTYVDNIDGVFSALRTLAHP